MCSINGGDLLLVKKDSIVKLEDSNCLKCKTEKASVKLRGTDVYCNQCFLIGATHKFRATLGKSKIVRPNDRILIAHSGHSSSTALLNLIRAGMHESVHKRLIFETKVVYIDDGFILNENIENRQSMIQKIIEQTKLMNFPVYVASLGELLTDKDPQIFDIKSYVCNLNENEINLSNIYEKLSEETSKQDFLHTSRQKLIMSIAKNLNCCKIFLADDSTSLAITVLSNVSLGRGAQLSLDVGFIDNRFSDVMILRPMRDFTREELDYYMDINNLTSLNFPTIQEDPYSSIQGLTKQFILDLDRQFGGTVATVFRTGEKLSSKSNNKQNNEETCAMCYGILDTRPLEAATSAIEATNFSRLVSAKGSIAEQDLSMITENSNKTSDSASNGCGNCETNCCKDEKIMKLTLEDISKCLCYACRTIFKNENNLDSLPPYVMKLVREKLALNSMRDEIEDFLL